MPTGLARLLRTLAGAAATVALMLWGVGAARADWTTYRGDAARSGVDSSSVGSLPFAPAWTSPDLGGEVWGQPLVHNGLVVVATESNEVWGLSESTGQKVWQASAGTPVPSSGTGPHPPCGDISPTVGITSTPVIDPATNRVFVVADTLTGGMIEHQLYAFNLSDGSGVPGFPVKAEPTGDVPADQLQRPGLALDNGQVIIGYGGNDGDCGTYHGWLVSIPETGGALRSFEVDRDGTEGAIWGAGNAPPVDSAGDVWVATGNGNTGSTYEFQESVLKLDSNMDPPLDQWAPSDWQSLDTSDADIGSSAPVLLPGGLVFQIGKQGIGYVLSASSLSVVGARYQASVCSGSWGGGIYLNGIIYVTCSNGLHALALNAGAATFAPLPGWQVNSTVNGPPILAGGLVWATDWNNATLYGLNPQTGQTVVRQTTPDMEHFTTPSASDGKLFLATGQTVEAYTIANPAPPPPVPVPGTSTTSSSPGPAICALSLRSNRVKIHHPRRRKHSKHAPPAFGTVALIAECSQAAEVRLLGTVTERLRNKPHHRGARTRTVHLAPVYATLRAGVPQTIQIRLGPMLVAALEHRIRESGAFTLMSGGSAQARAPSRLRL